MVDGADYFLLCHDDVALFPDAVHLLVEEAFRSNAGIVSPKVVSWDDPERLVHVGMAVDKGGSVVDRVQPSEIDHGQHDAVRDVFVAPGGATLVRADLFEELGGFDTAIVAMGEDLDLCWRAQVVGPASSSPPMPGCATSRSWPAAHGPSNRRWSAATMTAVDTPGDPSGAPAPARAPGRLQVLRPLPPHPGGAPDPRARRRRGHRGRAGRQPGPGPGGRPGVALEPRPPGDHPAPAQAAQGQPPSRRQGDPPAAGGRQCSALRLRPACLPARVPRRPRRRAGVAEADDGPYAGAALAGAAAGGALDAPELAGAGSIPPAPVPGPRSWSAAVVRPVRPRPSEWSDEAHGVAGRRPHRRHRQPGDHRRRGCPWSASSFRSRAGRRRSVSSSPAGIPRAWGRRHRHHRPWPWPAWSARCSSERWASPRRCSSSPACPLGVWGVVRLLRPFGSQRASLVAGLSYLAMALPYNALALGRWGALVVYAGVPWVLARLFRATGSAPYAGRPGLRAVRTRRRVPRGGRPGVARGRARLVRPCRSRRRGGGRVGPAHLLARLR